MFAGEQSGLVGQRIFCPVLYAFLEVAQALACVLLTTSHLYASKGVNETSRNRILTDVLPFLCQLLSVPYDVVEALVAPDRALAFEQLIDFPGRIAP